MKHIRHIGAVITVVTAAAVACGPAPVAPYKNPSLSIEERTQDLLSRMTLEEKVGQLLCPLGWEMYDKQAGGDSVVHSAKYETLLSERHAGMLWATFRADPWTKKTLDNGLNPSLAAQAGNALQRYAIEHTRLGIPLFLAEESAHGHMAIGATVFPAGIGQAATWNPALIRSMAAAIAREVRAQGAHIGYGPLLDLSRDPRWSRVEESFGEDPVLTAGIGSAFVEGATGGSIRESGKVLATLKHFAAYGIPEGGHNGRPSEVGVRALRAQFLPPFKAAIDAGALSVMTSYNAIDGIPCTASRFLLTGMLREEWHFKGFTVSDLGSIEGLCTDHRVAETVADAALMAAEAGLDADLGGEAYVHLIDAVRSGRLAEATVDTAVARILRLKFAMGLFEHPYVDTQQAREVVRCAEHVRIARMVAQESIVLLKNAGGCLPLDKNTGFILVVGPNADNAYNMLGDYTAPQADGAVVTVLAGIRARHPAAQVSYVRGCAIRDTLTADIDRAVAAARRAEVVIAVVGGSSARDFKTNYIETGAAVTTPGSVSDMECGEGFDRLSLDLLGRQPALLSALKATGKPLVVVYIQGRPLSMNWAAEHADALLTAWYPGQEGGHAIADVLFGDYNPAGRLPLSVPRSTAQLPVHYNRHVPRVRDYVEGAATPLYPFGYGLSYSTFGYDSLTVAPAGRGAVEVAFTVANTGRRDGDEVVQLYLRDEYASTVQPLKQLKRFARIGLKAGESRRLSFTLTPDDLAIIDQQMNRTVEPGRFTVMVGASSEDIRLEGEFLVETLDF
ncbi:MAG: glycoside hydrolase family 3 C-terminal domain-containing protein [Prevotellaceae bacterium]|jgi:beta-glucosidase|nr:glycoside hydrolase family 3 C-terminal domain-containing protein [Prevotellaceae bacterium]